MPSIRITKSGAIASFVVACALSYLDPAHAASTRILVDFGASGTTTTNGAAPADDPTNFWNNVTDSTTTGGGSSSAVISLIYADNAPTGYNLQMTSRFNGPNSNGTTVSTVYTQQDATRDSLFGNTESFGTPALSNVFPAFKLTGLSPAQTYNLTFFASRTGVADNRETLYTITGATALAPLSLNAANNVDTTVSALSVVPSAAGEIAIALSPGPNNNNGNHFTYLNILDVNVNVPEPSSALVLIGVGAASLCARRRRSV